MRDLWCNRAVASSDDDIPDLFSPSPGSASPPKGPSASGARAQPRPPQKPGADNSPARETTGLELEVMPHEERAANSTRVMGTPLDEMEFDPMASSRDLFEPVGPQGAPAKPASAGLDLAVDIPDLAPPARLAPSPVQVPATREVHGFSDNSNDSSGPAIGGPAAPAMVGEVDLGEGLDDLDFDGAAAAQLNVAIPMPSAEDDIPWPTGHTPYGDELAVDPQDVARVAGFGPAPTGIFQTPLYAMRISAALRLLREQHHGAKQRLASLERSRDERLAELAEEKRPSLEGNDRFSGLFSSIDRYDEEIRLKKRALEHAGVGGAQALSELQEKMDRLAVERSRRERARNGRRAVLEAADEALNRARAAVKRLDIQWRNIEQRAKQAPGEDASDEFEAQLDLLEAQLGPAKASLEVAKEQRRQAAVHFENAEDELRVCVAEMQRCEGEKEGLLIAHEGEVAHRSGDLDSAVAERHRELASAARAILDLRGEVAVSADVRRELLAMDRGVREAALELLTLERALHSMDKSALETGKAIWIGAILALFALLVLAAVL